MEETKKQITTEEKCTRKDKSSSMNNALLLIVGVLIIMSAIQIFQFQRISKVISNGGINLSTQAASNKTALTSQVGGCG